VVLASALAPPVTRAALLVALEGLVLVVLGIVYGVAGLRGGARSVAGAELGAALIVGAGVLLLLVARGLQRRRGWARSPAVAVQLLTFLTGLSLVPTGIAPAAFAAMALGGTVTYLLFTAAARAELDRPGRGV
jgi:hypothetical protein